MKFKITIYILFLINNIFSLDSHCQNYYQLALTPGYHSFDYKSINNLFEMNNFHSPFIDVMNNFNDGLIFQVKPFHASDTSSWFINKSYIKTTLKTNILRTSNLRQWMLKFDYGIEHLLNKYIGFCLQSGINYNWSDVFVLNSNSSVGSPNYYFINNGLAVSAGGKIVLFPFADALNNNYKSLLITVFELEFNAYSPNLITFSSGNARQLRSEEGNLINDFDYFYPLGFSLNLNMSFRIY